MLAMRLLRKRKEKNFIIFSDSMSSLQALNGFRLELDLIQKILKDYSHRVCTSDVQFDHLSSPRTFQLQTRTRTPSCIAFSSTATLTWVCCMVCPLAEVLIKTIRWLDWTALPSHNSDLLPRLDQLLIHTLTDWTAPLSHGLLQWETLSHLHRFADCLGVPMLLKNNMQNNHITCYH